MHSRLVLAAVIFSILNSFFVILPQFEQNQNLKSHLSEENTIQIVSQNTLSKISDIEIITIIDTIIKESGLNKKSYEYSRDDHENLKTHIIILSLEGGNQNIVKFTELISKIKGIKINDFVVIKNNGKINANLSLSVMGGQYDKQK